MLHWRGVLLRRVQVIPTAVDLDSGGAGGNGPPRRSTAVELTSLAVTSRRGTVFFEVGVALRAALGLKSESPCSPGRLRRSGPTSEPWEFAQPLWGKTSATAFGSNVPGASSSELNGSGANGRTWGCRTNTPRPAATPLKRGARNGTAVELATVLFQRQCHGDRPYLRDQDGGAANSSDSPVSGSERGEEAAPDNRDGGDEAPPSIRTRPGRLGALTSF